MLQQIIDGVDVGVGYLIALSGPGELQGWSTHAVSRLHYQDKLSSLALASSSLSAMSEGLAALVYLAFRVGSGSPTPTPPEPAEFIFVCGFCHPHENQTKAKPLTHSKPSFQPDQSQRKSV